MGKRKSTEYYKLKKHLTTNLIARGLSGEVYMDKINEYMDLWERRKQLAEQINELGVTIETAKGTVENRMVSLEIQTSRQMLAIFTALGFKTTAEHKTVEDDGDDDL